MRSGNLFSSSKRGGAVLDAPERGRVGEARAAEMAQRRGVAPRGAGAGFDRVEDFDDDGGGSGLRAGRSEVRLSFSGSLVPRTLWGRIAAGCAAAGVLGAGVAGMWLVHGYLLRDEHFMVRSPASVEIVGNAHLTRPQLLSVFGEDVERNVFNVPMAERRAQLERLPWVGHATVMRLLPNRVRVAIVERTPVAFVRQGGRIGLVDANGVLLDMSAPGADGDEGSGPRSASYSFPVLTGIAGEDPLSTRAARMKIYMGFVAALDASGEKISRRLSEVDLSNPEDVKAILPDGGSGKAQAGADILVHFGGEKYLERYRKFEEHLPEWRGQYPKLASVDMRYERQVVLEMAAGTAVPVAGTGGDAAGAAPGVMKPKPLAAGRDGKAATAKGAASATSPAVPAIKAGAAAVTSPARNSTAASVSVVPLSSAPSAIATTKPAATKLATKEPVAGSPAASKAVATPVTIQPASPSTPPAKAPAAVHLTTSFPVNSAPATAGPKPGTKPAAAIPGQGVAR